MTSNGKSCDYDTLTITIQYQPGLEMIGVGVAGQVYSLDDDIVLKACIIFQPPTTNCTTRDLWYHASETVFNFSLLRDEKAVLRWLTQHPHPNIMEAIDTSLSLMVHCRLSQIESFGIRILFERSITFTVWVLLTRIYKDNIFFDSQGRSVLGDFSASCPFGHPNPSRPTLFHGLSKTVSDATDRFAMTSLIYELEIGVRPEIIANDGELIFPGINTGRKDLDSLISNAWHGQYSSTLEMLEHAMDLRDGNIHRPLENHVSKDELLARSTQWRKNREDTYGTLALNITASVTMANCVHQGVCCMPCQRKMNYKDSQNSTIWICMRSCAFPIMTPFVLIVHLLAHSMFVDFQLVFSCHSNCSGAIFIHCELTVLF